MWVVPVIRSHIVLLVDLSRRSRKEAIRHGTNCIPEQCSVAEWCWCICETWPLLLCVTLSSMHTADHQRRLLITAMPSYTTETYLILWTPTSLFLSECKLTSYMSLPWLLDGYTLVVPPTRLSNVVTHVEIWWHRHHRYHHSNNISRLHSSPEAARELASAASALLLLFIQLFNSLYYIFDYSFNNDDNDGGVGDVWYCRCLFTIQHSKLNRRKTQKHNKNTKHNGQWKIDRNIYITSELKKTVPFFSTVTLSTLSQFS